MMRRGVCAAILTGVAIFGSTAVRAADMPALVAAYTSQLAQQCGPLPPGAAMPPLAEQIDLNGDKLDDWIVDAGRYPCPGRPAIAAAAGVQVTVFRGIAGGMAVPVLQRATFGSRLQRPADAPPSLWLTLGGSDCGSTKAEDRCERQVVWLAREGRFDVRAPAPLKPVR